MAFSEPERNIAELGIEEGSRVADLGSGSGFYSLAAAKTVGHDGRVYAVDIQKDLLSKLKQEAESRGISNIEVIWGDLEKVGGSRIRDNFVDYVVASNVLFQVKDKESFIEEIKRVLRPGGRLLLVDWSDSFGGMGPKSEMVVTELDAREMFEKAGFEMVRDIMAGAHHYGIIWKYNG